MKKLSAYIPAIILAAFALLTLFMSSSVIFDLFDIRAKEGNYVPFIVWANFACSLIYLPAAYGFWTQKKEATKLILLALAILVIAFVGLQIYIYTGGIHETKTVFAMIFRISVTAFFAILAHFTITKNQNIK